MIALWEGKSAPHPLATLPLTKADIEWFDGIGAGPSPSCRALEESTQAVNRPMSGVFNNLVIYKQDVPQKRMKSIVPELATRWSWNEEGTELTFPLRHGVKWHDGKPFTAADVKCTVDLLMGNSKEKLCINPLDGGP